VSRSASPWRRRARPACGLTAGFLLLSLLFLSLAALPSFAQENEPQGWAPAAEAPKPQGGDPASARLDRLEEKMQGLQVMIGTLESFIRTKPGTVLPQEAPAPAAQGQSGDSELGPRIDALETQITALTSHIEQISRKMSALEAKLSAAPSAEPPPERQGQAPAPPSDAALASAADDSGDTSKPRWYGAKPGRDAVADLLEGQAAEPADANADGAPQSLVAALPGGDAETLYQRGYGALLQKDYAGAEGAFSQLVAAHPDNPLAGNAQYWIGETYYARGQYKNAADAFLKGYKKYKSGEKAPDALLKLGMALAQLGQKDAACSTFNELKIKFPAAPEPVRDEAKAERKKAGC
jgi:tol-pal system protein YbgF